MIFGKYQLKGKLQERGYSLTCSVIDETDKIFFAKWIKGIKKDSQVSQMFFDKLRRLKKATHSVLPKIIDYQWEPTQKAYCIIFENKKAKTLEEIGIQIPPNYFLKGMLQLIDCLQYLQQKDGLTHGDITPANILVDENFDFYLIDFGLADTTASLSQTEGLVVFAKQFAAPEKWDRTVPKGFPYQSDIFSLGKVIEWFFEQKNINGF